MNVHLLWVIAITLFLAACGEQQPPAQPEEPEESQVAAPAAEPEEPQAAAPATEPEETEEPAEPEFAVSEEFLDHMHAHAEHMDDLMFALADGDLDGAMTPAYWLSRHRPLTHDVPEDWQKHILGMREAALAVEAATDLETARAAAEQISLHCQDCHSAAGVMVP